MTPAAPRPRRALTAAQRLALLRDALRVAAEEGFASAEVEVSERGAMRVRIDKAKARPAEIKL